MNGDLIFLAEKQPYGTRLMEGRKGLSFTLQVYIFKFLKVDSQPENFFIRVVNAKVPKVDSPLRERNLSNIGVIGYVIAICMSPFYIFQKFSKCKGSQKCHKNKN